ncbi:unnamed protein product [Diamesa tonsa]
MKYFSILVLVIYVTSSVRCLEFEADAEHLGLSAEDDNREPLNVDYIEGNFPSERKIPSYPEPQFPSGADQSNLFQHHFGDLFNTGGFFAPFGSGSFGNGFGGFNFNGFSGYKPWWKGPNVCITREEDIENKEDDDSKEEVVQQFGGFNQFNVHIESCSETNSKHICKRITSDKQGKEKTVVITNQCCHGFVRQRGGYCEKIDLVSIMELAKTLGAEQFTKSAVTNDLKGIMDSNITIFMPFDEAFMEFSETMLENNLVVMPILRNNRQSMDASGIHTKDLILNHIVKGWINIEDVDNEQLLTTEFDNSTIRMNVFPKLPNRRGSSDEDQYPYLYTANCIPIMKPNKIASNGIVHMIQNVLMPITDNVMDIIRSREDMTVLRTVLEKTKMDKILDGSADEEGTSKTAQKQFSIFAPTDSAFEKLDPQLKRKIKEGSICAENILKNHILDMTFCSAAVVNDDEAKTTTYNMLGEKMLFERSSPKEDVAGEETTLPTEEMEANKTESRSELEDLNDIPGILINGKSRIVEQDIMGTNGVVHIIDTVLETQSGLPITSMLQSRNLTIFKKLMEYGSFDSEFDALSNATYFVPTDLAFESTEMGQYWIKQLEEAPQKLKNNEKLKQFLQYHVVQPLTKTCDFTERMMPSMMGEPLRINLFSTAPVYSNIMNRATVNCARLIHFDEDSCGSVMNQVDKVLAPPSENLLEALKTNPQYSMFLKLVQKANLTSMLSEDTDDGMTLFVPKDEVFQEVADWLSEKTKSELENIIKSHIVPDVLCCAGIVKAEWPFVRTVETLNKNALTLNRDRRPKVQNAGITKCDVVAKNGIIHEINDIISINRQVQNVQQPQNNFYGNFFNNRNQFKLPFGSSF